MTREQIIAALEPFARQSSREKGDWWRACQAPIHAVLDHQAGAEDATVQDLHRAAEVLAELRKPTGFEEWRKQSGWTYDIDWRPARDAWDAATLSRIPADLRETLVEACDLAVTAVIDLDGWAKSAATRKRIIDARKRLEAGPVVERIPADLKQACIAMAKELEDVASDDAAHASPSKAKRYESVAAEYAKIRERLEAL